MKNYNRQGMWLAKLAMGLALISVAAPAIAQEPPPKPVAPAPALSRDGKRLLSTLDTLRFRSVSSPRISPDGTRVAYTVAEVQMPQEKDWKTVTHLWTTAAAGPASSARQQTRGESSVGNISWSPDGKSLGFTSAREKEGEAQVWLIWADGGEAWQVTHHKGGVRGFQFSPDGKKLLLLATDQPSKEEEERKKDKNDAIVVDHDLKMAHLWLADISSGEEKRLTEGRFTVSDPRWSPNGSRISFTGNPTPKADDGDLTDVWILTVATGAKKRLIEGPTKSLDARWSPDGKLIAYAGREHVGRVEQQNLFVVPADGGAPHKLTAELAFPSTSVPFLLDADAPVWTPDSGSIYFTSPSGETVEVFKVDIVGRGTPPAMSFIVRQVTKLGTFISLSEVSSDGRTAVGTISDGAHPPDVFRAPLSFVLVDRITDQNAWMKDYALGGVEVVKWKSKDGTEIEGVLTKPVDYNPAKKYPLLLNPHGGPTGVSLTAFSAMVQVFAANGYLVLQPNFRGSSGRGEKFANANRNDWGGGDYQDCMAGVQAIVDKGWADPQRLGAFGWSYGGYLTFWMLTQTDIFKAVSPGAGISDVYAMYSQNDIQSYLRWFYNDQSPWDNFQGYWDHSPMKYIGRVKTPTLILHGQVDTRVPIDQAKEFYQALSERGVPVEFVVFPRENHGFTEPRHIRDRLQRYLQFFGKYLNNPAVTETVETPKKETADKNP
jgi:dipeptidyl aminopeptidase/acylaminoacyl peptidase